MCTFLYIMYANNVSCLRAQWVFETINPLIIYERLLCIYIYIYIYINIYIYIRTFIHIYILYTYVHICISCMRTSHACVRSGYSKQSIRQGSMSVSYIYIHIYVYT